MRWSRDADQGSRRSPGSANKAREAREGTWLWHHRLRQTRDASFYSKLLLVLYCVSTMTSGVPVQLKAVPSLHTSVDVVQPSLSPTQQVAGWGTCSMTSRSGVSRSRSRELVSCRLSSKWKHKGQYWLWSGSVSCAVRVDCDVLDGSFYETISLATVGNASWEWESPWPRPVVVFRARPPPPPQPPRFLRHLSLIMEIYLCLPTCFTHSYRDEVPVPCVEEVRKFLWCSVFSVKWL